MVLTNLTSQEQFEEYVKPPTLSVVHFYADWASQCGQMNDVMEELSNQAEFEGVKFFKILAEEVPDISIKYKITAVPTFLLIFQSREVGRVDGANTGELQKKIKQCQNIKESPVPIHAAAPAQDLHSRLKSLINHAPVMLFMKGTGLEPRCKFSRAIIDILNSLNAEFSTFDILNDEEVRQGLKDFSKWPTYPQLYVKGELIGGLDIVKEMQESGDLEGMLPKRVSLDQKLKSLINKAPVMVFMKGNPGTPRCGFSRTLMEILKETGVAIETFDILEDEEVRQGLKELSKWPTYPQVYVNGELIGGLDIIKELKETGELVSTLSGA